MVEIPREEPALTPENQAVDSEAFSNTQGVAEKTEAVENPSREVFQVYQDLLQAYIRLPYQSERSQPEITAMDFRNAVLSLFERAIDVARRRAPESELRKQIFSGLVSARRMIDERSAGDSLKGVDVFTYRQSTMNLISNIENGETARIKSELEPGK